MGGRNERLSLHYTKRVLFIQKISRLFIKLTLIKLCKVHSKLDKAEDLLAAKQNALNEKGLKATDNLKPIVQHIYRAVDQDLRPVKLGKSTESFMRDILAPLIQPGMNVYKQLHKDIFGE